MTLITLMWAILGIAGALVVVSRIGFKKHIDWRIGLGMVLVGTSLFALTLELPQYGYGFGLVGTLIIAVAALLAIRQSDERDRVERRTRKLIEVIVWATDIIRCEETVPAHLLTPHELKRQLLEFGEVKSETLSRDIDRITRWHNADEKFQVMMGYQSLAAMNRRMVLMAGQLDSELGSDLARLARDTCRELDLLVELAVPHVKGELEDEVYRKRLRSLVDKAKALVEQAEAIM